MLQSLETRHGDAQIHLQMLIQFNLVWYDKT